METSGEEETGLSFKSEPPKRAVEMKLTIAEESTVRYVVIIMIFFYELINTSKNFTATGLKCLFKKKFKKSLPLTSSAH